MLEIRNNSIPEAAMVSLVDRSVYLRHTAVRTVFHSVWVNYGEALVGVFGDGSNGSYEWFIWSETSGMRTSDAGFGNDCSALCCGLVEARAMMANGDHDLLLRWKREEF